MQYRYSDHLGQKPFSDSVIAEKSKSENHLGEDKSVGVATAMAVAGAFIAFGATPVSPTSSFARIGRARDGYSASFFSDQRDEKQWRAHFLTGISKCLQSDVEDGITHGSEAFFEKSYKSNSVNFEEVTLRAVRRSKIAHNLLRSIGRIEIGNPDWRAVLLKTALTSKNTSVRDAAIQLVENWEDPNLSDVLEAHVEEQDWLAEYKTQVLEDLRL